ncbi:hypothetical protein ACH4ND_28215 [Streptomyces sp. NPDC017179]|uniref:hypothetical protein n=1 Tax=Streptomyces sp. NPDC017179 TaxID=3364979 RepID=UPI0037BA125B
MGHDLLARRPEEDFDDTEDFDDAIEAWDERWDAVMFAPERTAGAIVIRHLGCALREWLIISGSHRDTIWADGRADDAGLVPLLDDAERVRGWAHFLGVARPRSHRAMINAIGWAAADHGCGTQCCAPTTKAARASRLKNNHGRLATPPQTACHRPPKLCLSAGSPDRADPRAGA